MGKSTISMGMFNSKLFNIPMKMAQSKLVDLPIIKMVIYIDLPIKNGDFSIVFSMFTNGVWKPRGVA